jgi:UDP-N-acetyl-2-amino-2-deoxyglucuronate dehydrogenase
VAVRIGVIGTGFMGRTWSEVATNHVEGASIVAVAGGRRAPQLATDYGATAEPSVDALLARKDVDLVVVATQPDSHEEYVVMAGDAGKHVLVEKPMATSVAEADAMVKATEGRGLVLAVCSQHRFRASPVAAIGLIERGEIGDVRMVRAQGVITQDEEAYPDNAPWYDMGSHIIDVLRAIVRSPATTAFGRQVDFDPGRLPAGKSTLAVYGFASGAMAQVWITYELPAPGLGSMMNFLVTGSTGMIRLDSYGKVELGKGDGWSLAFEQPAFDPNNVNDPVRLRAYADELRDVMHAIQTGGKPLVNGRWGRDGVEMLDAVQLSAERGETVTLPLGG